MSQTPSTTLGKLADRAQSQRIAELVEDRGRAFDEGLPPGGALLLFALDAGFNLLESHGSAILFDKAGWQLDNAVQPTTRVVMEMTSRGLVIPGASGNDFMLTPYAAAALSRLKHGVSALFEDTLLDPCFGEIAIDSIVQLKHGARIVLQTSQSHEMRPEHPLYGGSGMQQASWRGSARLPRLIDYRVVWVAALATALFRCRRAVRSHDSPDSLGDYRLDERLRVSLIRARPAPHDRTRPSREPFRVHMSTLPVDDPSALA